MINLFWPVYKNLEKEVIELSNQIHFDDDQLSIYSIKISELLIRCSVEIEAISKELFLRLGGVNPEKGDLYFDTHCLQLLEENWQLGKKKLILSSSNFYFQNEDNRIINPLNKANKRGTSSCDWKRAYQAVKHNRTINLKKGNIKNLIGALGALFILNIYYKDEVFNFENDSRTTNFPINLGSDIFAIKLHKWFNYDGNFNYKKKEDFDECIYFTQYTNDSLEKNRKARKEAIQKEFELFSKHPKFQDYFQNNKIEDYKGNNFMWDILGKDDYYNIIRLSGQKQLEEFKKTKYEAVLNKNTL